jgi:hypothetical protein
MERAISRAVTFGPNAKSNRMDGAMAREQASCYGVNLAVGGGFGGGRTTSQNGTGCFAPLLSDRRHQSNRMDGAMAREQASCCGVNLAAAVGGGFGGGGPSPKMEQDASGHYLRTEGTTDSH